MSRRRWSIFSSIASADHRRAKLANDVQDAQQEFREGRCSPATPGELMKEILT
jgi:hypothetical protein